MADLPSGAALVGEMFRLSEKLEDGLSSLEAYSKLYARSEDAYRCRRATLMLDSARELAKLGISKPTVDEKAAFVDLHTSAERREARESEAMMLAGREAIKARRAQLSALQSVANIAKAEAEFARTGPNL